MINKDYIINIKGKEFILYAGILNEAHDKGLACVEVTMVQLPTKDNGYCCICRAVVVGKDGQSFADFGDASPESVDRYLVPHIIRCAATRAKARALRDFTNIGMCSVDELNQGEMDEQVSEPITQAQLSLLKKLSAEQKIDINYATLDKQKASRLISEMQKRKVG